MPRSILAWHFVCNDYTLGREHKGKIITANPGLWLRCDPKKLELCEYGLHASVEPLNALTYAPGSVVCRVRCGGRLEFAADKLVCSSRKILWIADANVTLREFARWCALQVVHLWDCPPIVREYLETGREEIRDAVKDATRDVAGDAAWAAAWVAERAEREKQNAKLEELLLTLRPKDGDK